MSPRDASAVSALETSAEATAQPESTAAEDRPADAPETASSGTRVTAAGWSDAEFLLPAGLVAVAVVLLITAADVFGQSDAAGPWWGTAFVSVAGIAAAAGGWRRSPVVACVILVNLVWYLVYSFSVIATIHSTSPVGNFLAVESFIGAGANACLLPWLIAGWRRLGGALYPLLITGVAAAQVLNALAVPHLKLSIWTVMAWVCVITAAGCLVAAALLTRRPRGRAA